MSWFVRVFCLMAAGLASQAASLEYLSVEEMAEKATAIVRGRVTGSEARFSGPLIYTHYTVEVLESWKGPEARQLDVVIPGGVVQGSRQAFSGTPALIQGSEYVLFLWTSRSGLTHVAGLSQGAFSVKNEDTGEATAARMAHTEGMLDPKTGRVVTDKTVRMRLSDLRLRLAGRGREEAKTR